MSALCSATWYCPQYAGDDGVLWPVRRVAAKVAAAVTMAPAVPWSLCPPPSPFLSSSLSPATVRCDLPRYCPRYCIQPPPVLLPSVIPSHVSRRRSCVGTVPGVVPAKTKNTKGVVPATVAAALPLFPSLSATCPWCPPPQLSSVPSTLPPSLLSPLLSLPLTSTLSSGTVPYKVPATVFSHLQYNNHNHNHNNSNNNNSSSSNGNNND